MAHTKEEEVKNVPMALWGKDHWSTLAYIETRTVDYKGVPDRNHMRCDVDRHPGLAGRAASPIVMDKKYPTLLKGMKKLYNHDDWDCVEDMIAESLLEWEGTGIHPVFVLTKRGKSVCAALRIHKQNGGQFAQFVHSDSYHKKISKGKYRITN